MNNILFTIVVIMYAINVILLMLERRILEEQFELIQEDMEFYKKKYSELYHYYTGMYSNTKQLIDEANYKLGEMEREKGE